MTAIRAAFKAYRMHQVLIMPRFARLTIALGLATAVFPVDAEYYFNPRFLSNDLAESVDLSAFTKGREAPPGTYRVDIYLNDEFMTSRDITFIADDNNAELIPCLSTDLLVSLGIKKSALLDNKEHSAEKHVPDNSACTPLQDRLADASTEFDVGQQHLSLSVPQIYVGRMARGYVSPDLWEEGINAGLLNYSFNGNSINNRSNHNAGKSNYAYLNLQSGINIGSWRLRDNSTWSYYSGSSNSSDSNKWQHINTSAERDIIPLRSRLTVGDSYTDGDIFDSVNFRGLKINSTEAMLPDSQHGFAPVIHGIARGTAQVSVKQNGYDVYQTTVPPGPFTIDDINSAANGGDLQVTIKEADGSIQTLYVPYSSVPVLQRAGYTRYALAMGEYRSGNNLQSSPKFIQGSLMHGLEGNWTPYGGMQIAEDYQAFNLGIGKDLGLFGAFSFDITQANTTLADGTRHSGQSVKSVYSKSFYQTGTNIQVAGYRYSTQGFYNLSDSAYSRMSGYTVKPPTGDTNEQTQFIDYFNLFYSKRGQEQISISQQLGNYGTTCYRRSNSGNGTFAKVIAAIERLKSYQVEFNTLTVINNVNVHYPLEVYHFLKSIGSKHMQFIELLETGTPNIDFSGHSENTFRIIDFSVPPTAYGKFMSTIFMQWVKNDVGEIFIRQFESFVSRFLGNGHTSCIFQESCKDNLVVESNGDIYECDHFVYPQYKIGNINKSELKTMNSVQLTAQKKRISAKCQQCAYKPICNGGCPKHRITKVNNETVSYFCEGYKILFSTMVPYMNAMVELAKNRVPLYHIMDVAKQMENN